MIDADLKALYSAAAVTARRTPKIIITQHPDHATAVLSVNRELTIQKGAVLGMAGNLEEELEIRLILEELKHKPTFFHDIEFMVDYEGKGTAYALFKAAVKMAQDLGIKQLRITPRLPALSESVERNGHVALEVRHANVVAKEEKMSAIIREVILPQVKSSGDFEAIRAYWSDCLNPAVIDDEGGIGKVNIIPLIEDVSSLINVVELLTGKEQIEDKTSAKFFKKNDNINFEAAALRHNALPIRVMMAMSDPAIKSGATAARIALRMGLSRLYRYALSSGQPIAVIFGGGTLPFRGAINPDFVGRLLEKYPVETVTIQGALLYDHPAGLAAKWQVYQAVSDFRENMSKPIAKLLAELGQEDVGRGKKLLGRFEAAYEELLGFLALHVQKVAPFVPDRRQRTLDKIRGSIMYNGEPVLFERAIKHNAALLGMGFDATLACLKGLEGLEGAETKELYQRFDPLGPEYIRQAIELTLADVLKRAHREFFNKIEPCLVQAEKVSGVAMSKFGGIAKRHTEYANWTEELIWHSKRDFPDTSRVAYLIVKQALVRAALG